MSNINLIQGDALSIIKGFKPKTFSAIITDPPYASGGMHKDTRCQATSVKYMDNKAKQRLPDFEGDAKDQRSWTSWMTEWMSEARRTCIDGAPICLFIDWRQLPSLTDAMQWAGWTWRGVAVWDKMNSRPQKGRFKQQAEFIVWGSNGAMPINRPTPILPGVFRYTMPQKRIHQTEKPEALMREIVKICLPGGHILDPFAGSGTTLVAAEAEGYPVTGIEVVEWYANKAKERAMI